MRFAFLKANIVLGPISASPTSPIYFRAQEELRTGSFAEQRLVIKPTFDHTQRAKNFINYLVSERKGL